jgi:hypothetical protein
VNRFVPESESPASLERRARCMLFTQTAWSYYETEKTLSMRKLIEFDQNTF